MGPIPPLLRDVARDVLHAFGYVVDVWSVGRVAGSHRLTFHVPKTETVCSHHFRAATERVRRARVAVQWTDEGMRFTVSVPQPQSHKRARPADGASAEVHGNLDQQRKKRQRRQQADEAVPTAKFK